MNNLKYLIYQIKSEYSRMESKYNSAFNSYLPNTLNKKSEIHPLPNTKK